MDPERRTWTSGPAVAGPENLAMKIIYLHQYFNTPDMSGGTRSYEMARRMVAAGHDVHMITSRTDGRLPGRAWVRENIEGIDVHWLPVRYDNAMSYTRRLLSFMEFARRAGPYAARLEADVVFATSTPLTIAIPAVKASRARGTPFVFEVRDLWPELPIAMGALDLPLAKPLARRLERWAYANAAHIVGLSPGMCEGVARTGYPREKIRCIPNSADIDLFDVPEERGRAFRAQRSWLGDRPLVIYAGTFGKINGVSYLAELAAAMKGLDPEVRFLAVGRGADVKRVRERAQALGVLDETFFMEDALPKAEMPALFSAASVSTSLFIPLEAMWNNSANKFFDTLAAGRPVAINYGGWQAELIAETGAGLVLDPADAAAAAQRLHAFLHDEGALSAARKASAALARARFSRDKLAADLIRVLEDAARLPASSPSPASKSADTRLRGDRLQKQSQ